ncbi:hypothetical protein F2P56_022468 [Juglans regia]|uniref:Retrotransposon Copia-like N-terminal domain-containing protein n=1 Tax=Juglans regia TaxID=51240 RepID=A0A833X4Q0_JUGRE|nr:hypothetical protein F2P56_022468 [Juglans regia]
MAPSPSPNPSLTNAAAHLITVKLSTDNFPLWKAQLLAFLKSHQLYGYIDGSVPSPPPFLDDKPNPAHSSWLLQDQMVISALYSSLTDNILSQVVDCATSHEIWTTLTNLYSAQSTAHLMQTRYQLATLKKGSDTISAYFHKAKALASSLSSAGHPLSSHEFIIYLLTGLEADYESVVSSITTRPEPLSISQVFSYLLNHESRLAHQTQTTLSVASFSANSTNFRPSSSPST